MDLREEFVLRAKAPGACIAALCREYAVSRKTGYKWLARFDAEGVEALADMSRRPRRVVETSGEVVLQIQELRAAHPRWGPKKLRVLLARRLPNEEVPSVKTIARILDRLGAARIRRPRVRLVTVDRNAPRHDVRGPNDVWTVDFKGWWRTRDGERCDPLTVRDAFSRLVLCLRVMTSTAGDPVRAVFVELFTGYGLPKVIHVDNGSPFGSTRARAGLSRLSAWWVALGITASFGRPAHPQDNGGHERMHADVAGELEGSAAETLKSQQVACDAWVEEFNEVRPHEAIAMKTPASLYKRSSRTYRGVRPARYPAGFRMRSVSPNGTIKFGRKAPFIGTAFAGYQVGVLEVDATTIRVHFYEVDLGCFDLVVAADKGVSAPRRGGLEQNTTTSTARSSAPSAGGTRPRRPRSR